MKKHLLALFLFTLVLVSCKSRAQDIFPDRITVSRSQTMKRMKGTKLFVSAPPSYQPLEKLLRLQKNDETYFHVIESPNYSFSNFKDKMSMAYLKSQGIRVDVYETANYNGLEGLYFEGPSKNAGETKLGFAFGNENFVVFIIGVCRTADEESRQELRKIFNTSYYDPSFALDPLELASFQLNEKITGFRYASSAGNVFLYLPEGKTELTEAIDFSYFQVMPLDAGSLEKMRDLLYLMHSKLEQQGLKLSNMVGSKRKIGGHAAFEILMDVQDKAGRKSRFYQVGIFKENSTSGLIFNGVDADGGAYLPKFRATVESLRW